MLCALFGAPAQTAVTGPPTRNILTWSDAFNQLPVTFSEKRGTSYYCFPGGRVGGLDLRLDKTQTDPLQISFDAMAMNQLMYAGLSDLGLDTATYDALTAFAGVEGALSIAGAVTADARSFDCRVNKNLGGRDVLNGYRGALGHYIQNSETTGTATLYFSTESELKRFFGVAQGVAQPYGAQSNVIYVPLYLQVIGQMNVAGFQNRIFLNLPNASYEKVGEPIAGPDAIMQEISYYAYHDNTTGTSVQVGLENSQTSTGVITPGTAISVVPANAIQPYVAP
jgi:hypothetical protein